MKPGAKRTSSDNQDVGSYLNLGLQLAVAVVMGMALGYFIDSKLNTRPLFFLIGLALGSVSGFLNVYRAVYPSNEKKVKHKKNDEK